jgi:hypothetical protein
VGPGRQCLGARREGSSLKLTRTEPEKGAPCRAFPARFAAARGIPRRWGLDDAEDGTSVRRSRSPVMRTQLRRRREPLLKMVAAHGLYRSCRARQTLGLGLSKEKEAPLGCHGRALCHPSARGARPGRAQPRRPSGDTLCCAAATDPTGG